MQQNQGITAFSQKIKKRKDGVENCHVHKKINPLDLRQILMERVERERRKRAEYQIKRSTHSNIVMNQ